MLIRVCGSADEWIDGLLICKTSLFLDVQCYCNSTTSTLTGILLVSSEILYSVLFFSLLLCLVVRLKMYCSVSTIAIILTVCICVFPHCNNRRHANKMLCNSLLTQVILFPFTFCLFTIDLQSCRQACLVMVNSVHSDLW